MNFDKPVSEMLLVKKALSFLVSLIWVIATIVFAFIPALVSGHFESLWIILPTIVFLIAALFAIWLGIPRFYEVVARLFLSVAAAAGVIVFAGMFVVGIFYSGTLPLSDAGMALAYGLVFAMYGGGAIGMVMFYTFAPQSAYPFLRFRQ